MGLGLFGSKPPPTEGFHVDGRVFLVFHNHLSLQPGTSELPMDSRGWVFCECAWAFGDPPPPLKQKCGAMTDPLVAIPNFGASVRVPSRTPDRRLLEHHP